MKKYRVWKTFPVQAGKWHTEEIIVEGYLMVKIDMDKGEFSGESFCIIGDDQNVKAIFSKEYSVLEIKSV